MYKISQGKYVPVEMNIQDEKVRIFLLFEKRVDTWRNFILGIIAQISRINRSEGQLENIKSVSLLAKIKSVLGSMKALGDVHNHLMKKTSDKITPLEWIGC